MRLNDLTSTPGSRKRRQRVGRGDASGWGGTAGRGEKGQKSRTGSSIRHHFEGGQTPTFRRIPKRGFTKGIKEIFNVVNVGDLEEVFDAGAEISSSELRAKGLIGKADAPLKVLGDGDLKKALKVKAEAFSESAKAKIEAAGGSAEVIA